VQQEQDVWLMALLTSVASLGDKIRWFIDNMTLPYMFRPIKSKNLTSAHTTQTIRELPKGYKINYFEFFGEYCVEFRTL